MIEWLVERQQQTKLERHGQRDAVTEKKEEIAGVKRKAQVYPKSIESFLMQLKQMIDRMEEIETYVHE